VKVGVFDFAELQRPSQRVDRGAGGANRPSLFEPDVPVDADPRKFGDFLAP